MPFANVPIHVIKTVSIGQKPIPTGLKRPLWRRVAVLCAVVLLLTPLSPSRRLFADETAAGGDTPEGYWKTIDDERGDVRSIVKIWKHTDGTLKGRIEKIIPRPGEDPNPLCEKCEGPRYNKPVTGMEFLWGFTGAGGFWKNGKVLDPENGKIYSCQLELLANGSQLKVFGYIRVLFKIGRSQIWRRCSPSEFGPRP